MKTALDLFTFFDENISSAKNGGLVFKEEENVTQYDRQFPGKVIKWIFQLEKVAAKEMKNSS